MVLASQTFHREAVETHHFLPDDFWWFKMSNKDLMRCCFDSTTGILTLSSIDILGWRILCGVRGAALYVVECSAASLAFTH